MMPKAIPNPGTAGLAALLALALAACGQSDVDAGGAGAEGSGALTAQLKASCVERVETVGTIGDMGGVADEICDCASRRAQSELSVADLATGDTSALKTIMTQCADEALASRAGMNINKAETR